jgi:hypothetical protein
MVRFQRHSKGSTALRLFGFSAFWLFSNEIIPASRRMTVFPTSRGWVEGQWYGDDWQLLNYLKY